MRKVMLLAMSQLNKNKNKQTEQNKAVSKTNDNVFWGNTIETENLNRRTIVDRYIYHYHHFKTCICNKMYM